MRQFNYNYLIPQEYPKNNESLYFHLRYSIISEEQDEEQIDLIRNCPDIERYVISIIEHGESENEKGAHRHVAIVCKSKRTLSSLKKKLITFKYNKNQIYFKPKYLGTTITDMVTYIIKNGTFLTNWDDKVDDIENADAAQKRKQLEKYEENKKKDADFREKFKHMKEGNYEWFIENCPKYMLTNDFNRGLVWAQDDAKKNLKVLRNFYIVDKPGTGKSSAVLFVCDPNRYYLKSKSRDTFDGWNNFRHKDLHIDELDTVDSTACIGFIEGLNEMTTHAPFGAKFMYANRTLKIRPERLFITANTKASVAFGKDRHGKPVANSILVAKQLERRFGAELKADEFHAYFGLKMVCVDKRRKANIICFDFIKIKEEKLIPRFEYFDDYLTKKFEDHLDYWLKYGEERYINWLKHTTGLAAAYKAEDEKVEYMQKLVLMKLKLSEIEEIGEQGSEFNNIDEFDEKLDNLSFDDNC